jgi:hypothetical protein
MGTPLMSVTLPVIVFEGPGVGVGDAEGFGFGEGEGNGVGLMVGVGLGVGEPLLTDPQPLKAIDDVNMMAALSHKWSFPTADMKNLSLGTERWNCFER